MKMPSNKVIVIGGNHHNTLGVIRALGIKDIYPFVIMVSEKRGKRNYVLRSRYISGYSCFSNYDNAVEWLLEKSHKFRDSVIICTSDGASSAVDSNYDRLSSLYRIPNAGIQSRITQFMNKDILCRIAEKTGLKVPLSVIYDYKKPLSDDIEFPCIIKPLLSIEGSKSDILICHDQQELLSNLERTSQCGRVQIQKFVEKDFEFQLIGCSLDGGEKIIIPGVSKVIRPSDCSNTGFLNYQSLDDTYPISLAKKLIHEIGYSGLFSMEFLRDKSGNDYFMEINFRNDGNAICVTAAGVNLPYIWCLNALEGTIGSEPVLIDKEVFVMPEFDDFIQVIKGNLSFSQWIRDIKRTDCFMEYYPSDKKPFYFGLVSFVGSMVSTGLKKMRLRL